MDSDGVSDISAGTGEVVCLFHSTAEEGQGVLAESLHLFVVLFIFVLAVLTCGPDNTIVCLR